jgi:pyruvate/2-oxoglutarate dehydrogenase complex dihydrolipoamide dehydrogenase (E3) component
LGPEGRRFESYHPDFFPFDEHNEALQSNVHPARWNNPKPAARYNLVVVGGGTAGLVAAAGAAGLGAKVALIERDLLGGDCLNVGCVPSKSLIASAREIAVLRGLANHHSDVQRAFTDFPAIMERMRRLRAKLSSHDSAQRFQGLGVDVFLGSASFLDGGAIGVGGERLAYRKAVVVTGARASVPEISGLAESGFLTNESLFSLTELPPRLVVMGGGPIGCEMAQCFGRFGSQVTMIETGSRLLANDEPDAAAIVQKSLEKDGVRVYVNSKVIRVERSIGSKSVIVMSNEVEHAIECDQILVCIGRTPNVDGLGLDTAGIEFDPRRGIVVDDYLRTTNRNVYAAGDVCSTYKFTHAADFMARLVIQNALFMGRARVSRLLIPWCTYTSPEVAHVGLTTKQLAAQGIDFAEYRQPFSAVDRAVLAGTEDGFVSVFCRRGSDRILGATVVAEHAGEMIGELTMAIKHRIGLKQIASVIHPYPTCAEAIRKLGDQYNRQRLTPFVKSLVSKWLSWNR